MNRKTIWGQLPSLSLTALFLLAWELLARRTNAAYTLPPPTQILRRICEPWEPLLLVHLPATMTVVAASLLLSLLLGIFLAILVDQSKTAERTFYPLLVTSQIIPTTALTPSFILQLSYSIWDKVLATVLMIFFPIAITLSDSFRVVPSEMTELMQTLGTTRWQSFWKLELPTMLPSFFTAIRMVIPFSVIGAAIGEWLGAQAGLGYFSCRMMVQFDGADVFASIALLGIAAMLFTVLARQIETRVLRF